MVPAGVLRLLRSCSKTTNGSDALVQGLLRASQNFCSASRSASFTVEAHCTGDILSRFLAGNSRTLCGAGTASFAIKGWLHETCVSPARAAALRVLAVSVPAAGFGVYSFGPQRDDNSGVKRDLSSWTGGGGGGGGGLSSWMGGSERMLTNLLIAANVATYMLQLARPSLTPRFAMVNYMVKHGEWWRLVTSAFLHADIAHLGVNMLSLHLFAPNVEALVSKPLFLVIYLGSAVAGNIMSMFMLKSGGMSIGASGAISGLFGAYLCYKLRNKEVLGTQWQDLQWAAQIVGINLLISMWNPAINNWAHLGGALGGAALMWLFGPRYTRRMFGVENKPVIPIFK